ncbi:MAG: hypothetical protein JNL30_06925 [Rubrivivax sp.]|nr:hypothetical protein [Rubrivivax sp.]
MDDAQARLRTLPHRWQTDCADCRTAWYRFDLGAAPATHTEAQALWLTSVGRNAAAYLNGRLLGSGGRFSDPAARLGAQALLLPVPPQAWSDGDNRLYVLVKAERARFGHLGALALAPERQVQSRERWRSLLLSTLPQVLATAAAMLGIVMAVLWVYRRRRAVQEADYGALAAVLLAWALHHFSAAVLEPPLPDKAWDAWLGVSLACLAAALVWLALRLAAGSSARSATPEVARPEVPRSGARAPRMALSTGAALAVPLAAAAPWEPSGLAIDLMHSVLLLMAAGAGALLVAAGWRAIDGRLLTPGALLAVTAGAAALWPWLGLPSLAGPPALALPWAMAVLAGALGWWLLLRFVHTLDAAELLAVDLEALVRERTAELSTQFERVRELERRQTIATERERLMRDMHDGVGGHLVSMLAMIETTDGAAPARRPAELAAVVRDALEDMRLMIDSLEPVDDDLNAVLAMFHDRLAPRLRAAGVALHWDVELLPQVPGLTPARVLHVLRILQEAVTNAMRHGRCTALWLHAERNEGSVRIGLRDDGCGFDPGTGVGGRGLANMRRRAQLAAMDLVIASQPGQGARLDLRLALSGAETPQA